MSAALQIANASVAAIFAIALLVTTHRFVEYRSTQGPTITFADRTFVPF